MILRKRLVYRRGRFHSIHIYLQRAAVASFEKYYKLLTEKIQANGLSPRAGLLIVPVCKLGVKNSPAMLPFHCSVNV